MTQIKPTIKAKIGYTVHRVKNLDTGEVAHAVYDGDTPVMLAKQRSRASYIDERKGNEAFELCEVFETVDHRRYLYWRDNEIDQDYITFWGVI